MGARISTISHCDPKNIEDATPNATDSVSPSSMVNPNASKPSVPRGPLGDMPVQMRPETFEEKLYRKFKAEPLVPIGCLTTAYFLASGIKSFYNRDPKKSQTMMRLRVGSQFATILIFVGYAGWNAFTLDLAPGMAVPSEQMAGVVRRKREDDE